VSRGGHRRKTKSGDGEYRTGRRIDRQERGEKEESKRKRVAVKIHINTDNLLPLGEHATLAQGGSKEEKKVRAIWNEVEDAGNELLKIKTKKKPRDVEERGRKCCETRYTG